MDLEFFEDPAAFLVVAGEHLAAQPVLSTVVATVAEREACEDAVRQGLDHHRSGPSGASGAPPHC